MGEMRIDRIDASGRRRKDLGDVQSLATSIERVGLLHPVVVTSSGRLVAGGRRLAAFVALGRDEIPVTIADSLDDARMQLAAELDENTCRLDMKPSEKVELGRALEELERPKARERRTANLPDQKEKFTSRGERTGKVYDLVGEAVGMSGPIYKRAKAVVDAAEKNEPGAAEALKAMDETGKVTPAYEKVARNRESRKQRAPNIDNLDTSRGKQRAEAHKRRFVDLVAQVHGLASGAKHIKTDAVIAVTDATEMADLYSQLDHSITTLSAFKRSLKGSLK